MMHIGARKQDGCIFGIHTPGLQNARDISEPICKSLFKEYDQLCLWPELLAIPLVTIGYIAVEIAI